MHAIMPPVPYVKATGGKSVVRTRETRSFSQEGLHGRLMFAGLRSPCRYGPSHPVRGGIPFPARSLVSRPKFRLAPFIHFFFLLDALAFLFLFRSVGEASWQWWTTAHVVLARRRNFPAQNAEKLTTAAGVSKRSRRCENGYRHVARSLVAPNSGMVSKIGGKTVTSFVPGNVG